MKGVYETPELKPMNPSEFNKKVLPMVNISCESELGHCRHIISTINELKNEECKLFLRQALAYIAKDNADEISHSVIKLTQVIEILDLNLGVDYFHDLLKQIGVMYIERRGNALRLQKRVGAGKGFLPKELNYSLSLKGLVSIFLLSKRLATMTEAELVEYKISVSKVTIGDIVKELRASISLDLEKETIKDYNHKFDVIDKNLGRLNIKSVTHKDIENWAITTSLEEETVLKVLRKFQEVYRRARLNGEISFLDEQKIDFSSIRKVVKQKEIKTETEKKSLSEDDVRKVENYPESILKEEGLYPISLAFQIHARNDGRRPGEMVATALSDFITHNGQRKIELKRAACRGGYKTTKTAKGVAHSIDVLKHCEKVFEKLEKDAMQYEPFKIVVYEKGKKVYEMEDRFLLVNPKTGEPYTTNKYREDMKRLQKLVGIKKPVPPMNLRHTFATLAKEAGMDDEAIARQMTHCSSETTRRHYMETVHQDTSYEVKQFDKKIGKPLRRYKRQVALKKAASGTMKTCSSLFVYATAKIKCRFGFGAAS